MRRPLLQHDRKAAPDASSMGKRAHTKDDEPPHRGRRRMWLAWGLALIWAGVIWKLGGDDFSMGETHQTLRPWLEWLLGDVDPRTLYNVYVAIRKSAHIVEYAILALLTFRAALLSVNRNRIMTACWSTLFIVAALATADEVRQAFSPVRGGSPYDVLIDITGGLIAIAGMVLISRRLRTPEPVSTSV